MRSKDRYNTVSSNGRTSDFDSDDTGSNPVTVTTEATRRHIVAARKDEQVL